MELDERLAAFNEGYAQFHQAFPDVFLVELDTLLSLSRTTDQPLLEYEAHLRRRGLFNYRGQNDQAFEAYDMAEEVALSLGDSLRLGSVKKNRGIAHATSQQYIEALDHLSSASFDLQSRSNMKGSHLHASGADKTSMSPSTMPFSFIESVP